MSYQVVIEDEAEQEMKEAAQWIAQFAPETAAQWYFDMATAIETLQDSPARCPLAPESRTFGEDIRHLIVGKYRILFLIDDEIVKVLRVRHGRQNTLRPDE
jgi:plasmid stabilization system protein ParE